MQKKIQIRTKPTYNFCPISLEELKSKRCPWFGYGSCTSVMFGLDHIKLWQCHTKNTDLIWPIAAGTSLPLRIPRTLHPSPRFRHRRCILFFCCCILLCVLVVIFFRINITELIFPLEKNTESYSSTNMIKMLNPHPHHMQINAGVSLCTVAWLECVLGIS